jgi:hypothetical protein
VAVSRSPTRWDEGRQHQQAAPRRARRPGEARLQRRALTNVSIDDLLADALSSLREAA